MVSTDSPASPDPVCSTDLARLPSPRLNLDTLSSNDAEDSVRPDDISVTLLCGSENGHTPVNSDQVLPDVDLLTVEDSGDRRQVLRTLWDARRMAQMGRRSIPLAFKILLRKSGRKLTSLDCQSPVPPRWSDQSIYRWWDGWRPYISLHIRCQDNCPPGLLRRSPLRIWGFVGSTVP